MKLTATPHVWNQGHYTVYEDEIQRRWIAYTHQIIDEHKLGCYCRIIEQENLNSPNIKKGDLGYIEPEWTVAFGPKDDLNFFIPYGHKDLEIKMNDIKRVDCDSWISIHSIGRIIENFNQ